VPCPFTRATVIGNADGDRPRYEDPSLLTEPAEPVKQNKYASRQPGSAPGSRAERRHAACSFSCPLSGPRPTPAKMLPTWRRRTWSPSLLRARRSRALIAAMRRVAREAGFVVSIPPSAESTSLHLLQHPHTLFPKQAQSRPLPQRPEPSTGHSLLHARSHPTSFFSIPRAFAVQ